MNSILTFIFCCILLLPQTLLCAEAPGQRILFVIDGSGSMKEVWKNETKWNIAKETLIQLIDSLAQKNNNVEFAIRVLGHQFPRTAENCEDSKLEIPFTPGSNIEEIKTKLNLIMPQGHTPIAYSLLQAAKDFTEKSNVINTVILITDGFETCKGDPCEVAKELRKKNIVISPYIIGLGVDIKYHENFKCVGTFVDVTDKTAFTTIVKKIVQQTISKTSCQIQIKDKKGNLTADNIPYTLYDQVSGNIMHNYVYALQKNMTTDTLYLNPQAIYSLQVHSTPSIFKNNIQLKPGINNLIQITLDEGAYVTKTQNKELITVVRKQNEILQTQPPIEERKYLSANDYELEILSLPYQNIKAIETTAEKTQAANVNLYGIVYFGFETDGIGAIFDEQMNKIKELAFTKGRDQLELLPGNYSFVYRLTNAKKTLDSKQISFAIQSGKTNAVAVK
jgi:Ca-activated chloride channel family protein